MSDMIVHARYLDPDGSESTPQSGRVVFTAAAPLILEAGAQRARMVTGVLDSTGHLCRIGRDGAAGERGVILSAPGEGVVPEAWTWHCQPYIQSHAGAVPAEAFDFQAVPGEWQLSGLIPVPTPGSTALVAQGAGVADIALDAGRLAFHMQDGREILVPLPAAETPEPDPAVLERLAALEARPDGDETLPDRLAAVEARTAGGGQATPHPRFGIIGDSHSDETWSPQAGQTWWQIATQAAGGILTEHGAQGHGGWTLRQLIDGQDGLYPLATALGDVPDFLLVEGAGNSAMQGRATWDYEADLREIITTARSAAVEPIVIFPPAVFVGTHADWGSAYDAYRRTARDLCEALRVPYWDCWGEYPQSPAAWNSGDDDHMNALGHGVFGALAGSFLTKAFGSWSDVACVPLTATAWGTTDLSPWKDGKVEPVENAPTGGPVRGKAVRLYHPGPADSNAGVQHKVSVTGGQRIRATFAYEITQGDDGGIRHGLQVFCQRTDTWAMVTPVGLIRHQGARGRGGFEYTVPADFTGELVISAALSADQDTGAVEAIVGNLQVITS